MTLHLTRRILFILVLFSGIVSVSLIAQPANAAPARQDQVNADPSATPTTPPPSGNPGNRPQILIESYSVSVDTITPGEDFDLYFTLKNAGSARAENISITFTPGDLIPRNTGGVLYVSGIDPNGKYDHRQPLTASNALTGGGVSSLVATVTYNDDNGAQYTGSFNLSFHINYPVYAPAAPTKTPTPITVYRPQMTIIGYDADVDPLQPGLPFKLQLKVRNMGNSAAKGVTMIMGGGTGSNGGTSGTPSPGGVSGSSGEFTNFAPLKSSNIQFLGDVANGSEISIDQPLIVNVSTNPGAYSVKFSFTYLDERGNPFTDDQVITLLVYQQPLVEVTFYHEAGPFYPGQPGLLPIQITNLSRKPTVLGNLKASVASGGQVTNNVTLVGAMDAGGYFTLDANLVPDQPGPLDIDITVSYTDDFNQPQTIHQKLQVQVQEQSMEPNQGNLPGGVPGGKPGELVNPGGAPANLTPETFGDKVVRFLKGMVGLDSGQPQTINPALGPTEIPSQNGAFPSKPIIVPGPGIKGG
jgi:hypothetical protein